MLHDTESPKPTWVPPSVPITGLPPAPVTADRYNARQVGAGNTWAVWDDEDYGFDAVAIFPEPANPAGAEVAALAYAEWLNDGQGAAQNTEADFRVALTDLAESVRILSALLGLEG